LRLDARALDPDQPSALRHDRSMIPEGDDRGKRALSASRAELETMLDELLERPYEREQIERRIEQTFTEEKAVLVLDMSGFSRMTQIRGIVPYLLMIHQMRLLSLPVVDEHGGRLVKAEADNLFCVFDSVGDALAASREIIDRLTTANVVLPKELALYASLGIGYGSILAIGDDDIWGDQVNQASRLGEDLADSGEVLLTAEAFKTLEDESLEFDEHLVSVSGLELAYYQLRN
jgi:adenylate cyclase